MVEIKLAQREHLPLIAEIENQSFVSPWTEQGLKLFLRDNAFAVCCFEDEVLVSYCTVITVLDEAQIANVATAPSYRGKGYAKLVIEAVLEESQKRGMHVVTLEVRESNRPAINLYESFEFGVEGIRKNFYTKPTENAFVMVNYLD